MPAMRAVENAGRSTESPRAVLINGDKSKGLLPLKPPAYAGLAPVFLVYVCVSLAVASVISMTFTQTAAASKSLTATTKPPTATAGVLDLTGWDFERDGLISLVGEWEFYWEELLGPHHFSAESDARGAPAMTPSGFITLPRSWNGYDINGEELTGYGYATFRMRVLHPQYAEGDAPIALSVPKIDTAYRLWAGGRLVAGNGVVGRSLDEVTPQHLPMETQFTPSGAATDLVLQVSNFHHRKGGPWTAIRMGTPAQVAQSASRRLGLQMLLVGTTLLGGLHHLGHFTLRRRDRSALYFGLFCVLLTVRALVVGEAPLLRLFPDIPWILQLRLEYVPHFAAVPLAVMFFSRLYPRETPPNALRFFGATSGIATALALFAPIQLVTRAIPLILGITAASVIVIILVLLRALRTKHRGAVFLFVGWAVAAATIFHDMVYHLGWHRGVGQEISAFGLLILILSQSLILALRFADVLTSQTALAAENARLLDVVRGQVAELEHSRRMMTVREERLRQQTAEYLHGKVQTRLLMAWHHLGQCAQLMNDNPREARTLLNRARDSVDYVREHDVRLVSHMLHPGIIQLGLVPAIRSLARQFEESLTVSIHADDAIVRLDEPVDNGIPPFVRLVAYRAVEEALNNVYRHADARRVRIDISATSEYEGAIQLRVEDDGRGFDVRNVKPGLGLHSIAGRVEQLGGYWSIQSEIGEGTTLTVTLPLHPPAEHTTDNGDAAGTGNGMDNGYREEHSSFQEGGTGRPRNHRSPDIGGSGDDLIGGSGLVGRARGTTGP